MSGAKDDPLIENDYDLHSDAEPRSFKATSFVSVKAPESPRVSNGIQLGSEGKIVALDEVRVSKKSLMIVYFTVFIDMLGYGLVLPSLPYIAFDKFGANGFIYGIMTSCYAICQMFGSIFCGWLSDRVGRKPVIIFCLFGSFLALGALGFVNSLWLLILVRSLDGLMSATAGCAQAYIADATPVSQRSKYMGMVGAANGFGLVCGPAIGGIIVQHYGWTVTCLCGASLSIVNFCFACCFLQESMDLVAHKARKKAGGSKSNWTVVREIIQRDANLIYVLTAFCLAQMGWSAFSSMFVPYARHKWDLTKAQLGYLFGLIGLLMMMTQILFTAAATRRFGDRLTTIAGSLLRAGGLFMIPFLPLEWEAIVGVCIIGVSGSFISPCLSAMASMFSDDSTHGSILGIKEMFGAFSRGLTPIICGLMYDEQKSLPFYFGAGTMGLLCVILIPLKLPLLVEKEKRNASSKFGAPLINAVGDEEQPGGVDTSFTAEDSPKSTWSNDVGSYSLVHKDSL